MNLTYIIRKLFAGLLLRCPNCERGRMFTGLFHLEPTCNICHARYERQEGESIGGTLINLCVAELLSIGGFIVTEIAFHPPLAFQLTFWVAFNLIFIVLFYRHARALWIAISYLSGGVYPDGETARQE